MKEYLNSPIEDKGSCRSSWWVPMFQFDPSLSDN